MVTVLDPYLIMRRDGNRVIVYPRGEAAFERQFDFAWRMIDPRAAVLLSLFDGSRSKEDVNRIWSRLNGLSEVDGLTQVSNTLVSNNDIIMERKVCPEGFRKINPEELICNMASLDYSAGRLHIPFSMLYMPTLNCSHNCRYCYADISKCRDPDELTLAELEKILDQAIDLRFADVSLSGGDPFLRRDVFDIIQMVFSKGFKPDIPTKSPLTDKQIQRLVDLGVDRLQISLDSPFDPDVVEYLTGTNKGYHKNIMGTLLKLGEAGIRVGITSVMTSLTVDSIPEATEYYASLGFVKRVSFAQVGGSIYRTFPDLYPPFEKYEKLEPIMNDIRARYKHIFVKYSYIKDTVFQSKDEREKSYSERPTCSGGRFAFILLPDGKVTLCEELYYNPAFIVGDLKKQSIMEMWHSPEMLRVIEPDPEDFIGTPCHDCEIFYDCHTGKGRCWKRALKAYCDKPNPEYWPDPLCPRAPEVTERIW